MTESSLRERRGDEGASPRQARNRVAYAGGAIRSQTGGPIDRAINHLLARGARVIPESFRERFVEEWADHRTHYRGWRLLWWALCVRVTATRTAGELRAAQVPHPDR